MRHDAAAQMFLDDHQQHVAMRRKRHAEKARLLFRSFTARVMNDRTAGGAALSRGAHQGFRLAVFYEYHEQLEVHVNPPCLRDFPTRSRCAVPKVAPTGTQSEHTRARKWREKGKQMR